MRQRLVKLVARLPLIGPLYLRGLLRAIERAPRHKLPPELQQAQGMLRKLPEEQRVDLLRSALRGQLQAPPPEQMGRAMRRAAQREARRKR